MKGASDDFKRAAAQLDVPIDPPPPIAGTKIDGDLVWEALSTVIDPEIGLDIVTLGLVYDVELNDDTVLITYSLTTPGCPMEEAITSGIVNAVHAVPHVRQVLPHLVWDPRWHPGMIEEGAW